MKTPRTMEDAVNEKSCLWPGGDLAGDISFDCREKPLPGLAYCATHHRAAHVAPRARKGIAEPQDRPAYEIEVREGGGT